MKIVIANIPDEGLDINFTYDLDSLKTALGKKDELKDYISEGFRCKCNVRSFRSEIFIKGEISINLKPVCFRCDREYEKDYKVPLDLVCMPDKGGKGHQGLDYMDGDVGINYYSGEEIDLGKIAREQLFLTLPMTYLCSEDCAGICPGCGSDLNIEKCKCKEKRNKE
jgi:uncharacterized protein